MAIFKCKMCGGTLEITNNESVAVCEYCGTKQTLPKLDDDRKAALYDRANHFRRNNEFDKAMGIYEQILNDDNTDAETYWSLVLCRYGIEYVEDPSSQKRIPTINRSQFTSVFDDEDYKSAIKYADDQQKELYENEATVINEIHKRILTISSQEEPFDVFICYKESDTDGRRTPDSVLATELYHELVREGFKVFFSRITLEDKLGQEYEPYIFAALNSAKVMVVLGTKPEFFNAVWVKNEWSRYLALIKNGAKKMLIPAYKDMDPYDLPEEFSHLQAQDMSKLGFMQDLIRGIKKIISPDTVKESVQESIVNNNISVEALIDRAFLLIEDGENDKADEYLEHALNVAPKHPMIYVGKLMLETRVRKQENLANLTHSFETSPNYEKAIRFADPQLKSVLEGYVAKIEDNNIKVTYDEAVARMKDALSEDDFLYAKGLFDSISDYINARELSAVCTEKATIAKKEAIYQKTMKLMHSKTSNRIATLKKAIEEFNSIKDYKDAFVQIDNCERLIYSEKDTLTKKKKRNTKIFLISIILFVAIIVATVIYFGVIIPKHNYAKAEELFANAKYSEAYEIYDTLDNYKDSVEKAKECIYIQATVLRNEKNWEEANALFEQIKEYKDSSDLIHLCNFIETNVKAPTCTNVGYKDFKCSGCGEAKRTEIKPTGNHNYKVVNSKNATCENVGFKDYKCSTCDHSYRDEIKATGHNYSSATCLAPKKCKTCGKTSGSALGHTNDGVSCSRCGTVIFKTLTYSGKGNKELRNINVPKGNFIISARATSTDGYAGLFYVRFYNSNYSTVASWVESVYSYKQTITPSARFSGSVNEGWIEIDAGNNVEWTITIEHAG